ncbi:MAG: Imm51 family immunity protein [Janthinobacterium lividum]
MAETFPFTVQKVEAVYLDVPHRHYSILVDVGQYEYAEFFEEYGYSGNGPSWAEHIHAILAVRDPELLNHLETEEKRATYLAYADSPAAVDRFMEVVRPIFADPEQLTAYFNQTEPTDFFE